MSQPISIVIPTLADGDLLDGALGSLAAELQSRSAGDEVLLVDDTGSGALAEWIALNAPGAQHIVNPKNMGFAASALAGAKAAKHELLFLMNPDVRLRAGCLDFLQETLEQSQKVWAVAPYVLLNGETDTAESLPELVLEQGIPRLQRMALELLPGHAHPRYPAGIPVAFALGGACLLRRAEFLKAPFDVRFEPFYWEDVDHGHTALRAGRQVLVDPRAVAEHHHRGTLGKHVPDPLVRAAIERNRMLFAWKHLGPEDLQANLNQLAACALEHTVCEEREELLWLALALERELGR